MNCIYDDTLPCRITETVKTPFNPALCIGCNFHDVRDTLEQILANLEAINYTIREAAINKGLMPGRRAED